MGWEAGQDRDQRRLNGRGSTWAVLEEQTEPRHAKKESMQSKQTAEHRHSVEEAQN